MTERVSLPLMSTSGKLMVIGRWIRSRARAWRVNDRGQVAVLFGLSITALMMAVGGGVDLLRAYSARQKLSQVATLACQYATRPSIIKTARSSYSGSDGATLYRSNVGSFITSALTAQAFGYTQSTATPFTYTVDGSGNVTGDVTLTSSVPTTLMKIANVQTLSVTANARCGEPAQREPDGNSPYLVREGFEASSCTGTCYAFASPTGSSTPPSSPSTSFPSSAGYTGSNGTQWYVMGYCVEIDSVSVIRSSVPEGSHSAELDCDNGSGSAGNSSISTKVYFPSGNYELRYFFAGRANYTNYDPAYVCGSAASDVAWANDVVLTGAPSNGARTNQVNVYLDLNTSTVPPLHTTIGSSQQLAGSNLIDMCVTSANWIERSVRIFVTTPGYYWLSFAADGKNDSYGGQIDSIRLCRETCPGDLQDNFPTQWLAANNGGVSKVLFQDTFESPVYTQDSPNHWITKGGNLNVSYGTSGTSASGWPNQSQSGWATAPYNQVNYGLNGAAQGSQHLLLDGYNSNGTSNKNRLVSRSFYLVPGYYRSDYSYMSIVDFSAQPGGFGTYCITAPGAGNVYGSQFGLSATGVIRYYNTIATDTTTNLIGMFMSHGSLVSTPVGGQALNSATSFNNPDGTVSTTPTVPPDNVNWTNYDPNVVNPVLDTCGYVDSYRWVARTVPIKIVKPGPYWLTFSANGSTSDGNGGAIDAVKLTALGSLAMTSPPSSPVAIPVPSPQPDTRTYFTGFYIVSDPLLPPAAMQ